MNVLLRQVLQLQSSRKTIQWIVANLIQILWSSSEYSKLVSTSCLANQYFEKAFRWAICSSTPITCDIIHHVLDFLRKEYEL